MMRKQRIYGKRNKMNKERKTVLIEIEGIINEEESRFSYLGDLMAHENGYILEYTDLQGNVATNNRLFLSKDSLVLKRHGGFSGTLIIDPEKETVYEYGALVTEGSFKVHTKEYSFIEEEKEIRASFSYSLYDDSPAEKIECRRVITVKL